MAYAFCLRFDAETEASVTTVWHALAAAEADEGMLRLGYPPHLSLAVLDDEPPLAVVDAAMEAIADTDGFALQLGGVNRFAGTSIVWLAVDGGVALGDLHSRLLRHLPARQVREHYLADAWVPHVTLRMDGDADRTMAVASEVWPERRAARFVTLELVQFSPIAVLRSVALGPGTGDH